MSELEIAAIDEAYKTVLIEQFKLYVIDSDSKSAYSFGALDRFKRYITHLREARALAVKAMVGDGSTV